MRSFRENFRFLLRKKSQPFSCIGILQPRHRFLFFCIFPPLTPPPRFEAPPRPPPPALPPRSRLKFGPMPSLLNTFFERFLFSPRCFDPSRSPPATARLREDPGPPAGFRPLEPLPAPPPAPPLRPRKPEAPPRSRLSSADCGFLEKRPFIMVRVCPWPPLLDLEKSSASGSAPTSFLNIRLSQVKQGKYSRLKGTEYSKNES